jgi:hypothetical protein
MHFSPLLNRDKNGNDIEFRSCQLKSVDPQNDLAAHVTA